MCEQNAAQVQLRLACPRPRSHPLPAWKRGCGGEAPGSPSKVTRGSGGSGFPSKAILFSTRPCCAPCKPLGWILEEARFSRQVFVKKLVSTHNFLGLGFLNLEPVGRVP